MLTQVDITNSRGNTLQLPISDASAGYSVRDIEGLDPVTATLTTSTLAQVDGAQFQNASRGTRNITMKLGLEPDYIANTVDSLRTDLYDYFMTKENVGLTFWKDGAIFATSAGQVEDFQNVMFTDDPEADISIICYDPDFYGPEQQVISASTTTNTDYQAIQYPGTSEAGVIFTLNVNQFFSSFSLYNTQPDGTLQTYSVSGSFAPDDVVTMTSIPFQKSLTLTRAGLVTSILYDYQDLSSTWPVLKRGENDFRAYSSGASIPYTLAYTPKYGAILWGLSGAHLMIPFVVLR